MRLKSYFADTVESAMALAAREMGEEAMLVYSRESSTETRGLGRYEVVFAKDSGADSVQQDSSSEVNTAAPGPAARSGTSNADGPLWGEVERRLAELEQRLDRGGRPSAARQSGELAAWRAHLEDQDLESSLVDAWLSRAASQGAANGNRGQWPEDVAAQALECGTGRMGAREVSVLVGPPGAGKTSAAIKLAYWYASHYGRMPRLVSFDTRRALGAEELSHYARVLGAEFAAPRSERDIENAFSTSWGSRADDAYTIVDTAGFTPGDEDSTGVIRRAFGVIRRKEVHLVLSAAVRTADLLSALEQYGSLGASRLVFTRTDETQRLGGIWTVSARMGLPVSFLSNGPGIPDDFEEARAKDLARKLMGSHGSMLAEPLMATGAP